MKAWLAYVCFGSRVDCDELVQESVLHAKGFCFRNSSALLDKLSKHQTSSNTQNQTAANTFIFRNVPHIRQFVVPGSNLVSKTDWCDWGSWRSVQANLGTSCQDNVSCILGETGENKRTGNRMIFTALPNFGVFVPCLHIRTDPIWAL